MCTGDRLQHTVNSSFLKLLVLRQLANVSTSSSTPSAGEGDKWSWRETQGAELNYTLQAVDLTQNILHCQMLSHSHTCIVTHNTTTLTHTHTHTHTHCTHTHTHKHKHHTHHTQTNEKYQSTP